ncbi:hypothetical protein [Corynebacterium kalidii]|uniref:Condensation domain-containing protein n=1 Tax=Corynebacterium kalidii TaxID=2931982 RepID=A0A9X2B0Z2_9CORY|nr:hypothetical protein [Corynebacterium kalidii]MCJ7857444.1 hypothetical protein [Corynebacterium kalidii]
MDVTYLENVPLDGPFTELELHWSGESSGPRFPLTFNQRNHLAAVAASGRPTWIGGTLGIPDGVPLSTIAGAVRSVVGGADALCAVACGDDQQEFTADQLSVIPGEVRPDAPAAAELESLVAGRCRPGRVPGLFFATCGDVLLFGIDHFHADMLSVALLQRRLHDALHGRALPGAPRFLDTVTAPRPAPDDAAIGVWRRFLDTTGNRIPAFPVELGVAGPAPASPVHDVRRLLDDPGQCTFAVILAGLAEAVEPLSGSAEFPTVIPVHTRGRRGDERHGTVGWMVGNAPVIARAGDVETTAGWLRDAVTVAGLPLETMIRECAPELPDGAVPMVSYTDLRRLGTPLPQARYVSATSPTDTVQFWFSRTVHGLDLRTKYPDTPEARQVMDGVLGGLERALGGKSLSPGR